MSKQFGVLDFGYDHFATFQQAFRNKAEFSVNLGDNIQSIAVRRLYDQLGVAGDQIVTANRDNLSNYTGGKILLVMNGSFSTPCFPVPDQIKPIFVGFSAAESLIARHSIYFKKHEPIGCRDVSTTSAMIRRGIKAYTTGCLTLTLPRRSKSPDNFKVFIVHGEGAGELPGALCSHIPKDILKNAEIVSQRMAMRTVPLGTDDIIQANARAVGLLTRYREEASLVITPLLHAASPCIAMGIPVILARKDRSRRFTAMEKIVPLYTPETFDRIDWNPKPASIENIQFHLTEIVRHAIFQISGQSCHVNALGDIFDTPSINQHGP